jgi:hypothetical protein
MEAARTGRQAPLGVAIAIAFIQFLVYVVKQILFCKSVVLWEALGSESVNSSFTSVVFWA